MKKNTDKSKINTAKKRVKKLWKNHDKSSIEIGLALVQLTDAVNDGDGGVTWKTECNATSFADYCRQIGFANRLEYKYRNAAENLIENKPEYVKDYMLVDDIDFLPSYTILNKTWENKSKLKKVEGAWEEIVELVFEKQASVSTVGLKCYDFIGKKKVQSISSQKTATTTPQISSPDLSAGSGFEDDNITPNDDGEFRIDSKDPADIIQEFRERLLSILPINIQMELFELKFNELADLFEDQIIEATL